MGVNLRRRHFLVPQQLLHRADVCARFEAAGYEVVVFAAVGTGGRTLESLVEAGLVVGVLDVTTTEWAMNGWAGC